jgi:AAA domain (dynein-related subfamily)
MDTATSSALGIALVANIPVLLWGGPGTGKSSVIVGLAKSVNVPCETVIASIRDPSDFGGLPVVREEGVELVPPRWAQRLASAGSGILFLDEISTAPPAVQAALLRVVLERTVGDLALPPAVRIVAAANPPEQAADGWDLAPPLANRFCHLDWSISSSVWADGFVSGFAAPKMPTLHAESLGAFRLKVKSELAAYLATRPGSLSQPPVDGAEAGRAWPSPRSWTMAADLFATAQAAHASDEVIALLVAGCVGPGAAGAYLGWRAELDLGDPEDALRNPDDYVIPDRGDRAYASLNGVVGAVLSNNTPDRWANGWRAIAKGTSKRHPDLAIVCVRRLLANKPEGAQPPREVLNLMTPVLREAGLLDALLNTAS